MQALVALAKERFGRVDVLFANAGIMPAGPMSAMDYTGWMAQVDVNVKGVLNAMAAVLPDFTGQKRGHIIATSSVAGTTLVPYNAVYCGTKHFVRAMLSSFRTESVMEGTNIRTTVIYPGKIATELLNSAAEGPGKEAARKAYAAEAIPAGAIADAVLYAVGQPDSVDVSDIVVRPTAEA
jgi:NADP-dependent 3-hydroxy acid dehydrogenase YdfG